MKIGEGIEHWTDERGKDVEIETFFSKLYSDHEVRALSRQYEAWQCKGEQVPSSLGECEAGDLVARLLALALFSQGSGFVGVKRSELEIFYAREGIQFRPLDELINSGYLRAKHVAGTPVIFPTEKLIKNQRVPKSGRPTGR